MLFCNSCDLIWQKNQPDNKLSYELYENIIDNDKSYQKSIEIYNKSKKRYYLEGQFFKNYFKKESINILDYGAGWGSWLNALSDHSFNLFATELSEDRIKKLKSNKINLVNLNDFKKYENYFDVIRLEQVLEHIGETDNLIFNLSKLIKKNGLLCIGVPDGNKIIKDKKISIEKGPIQPLEHLNCFNTRSLCLLMKKHDFRKIKINELIFSHLVSRKLSLPKLRFMVSDLRNNIFSTTIKFIKI